MPKLPPTRAGLAFHIPGGSPSPDVGPEGVARATVCRGLEAHTLIFRNQGGRLSSVGKMPDPKERLGKLYDRSGCLSSGCDSSEDKGS